MAYPFSEIEARWQSFWEESGTFDTPDPAAPNESKFYILDMFPYPSGVGLHVGHPLGYIATDIVARYKRMCGVNVLHPIGFDAFGLPAEQFAVEHGVHPRETTEQNIENMLRQLKALGLSYDWNRVLATTDPDYYRWTQWIFLKLFGSYYDAEAERARPIAELIAMFESGERSPRDGSEWSQWMLRITAYADRLEKDLGLVDWPEAIKTMQRNWIGKSEGAVATFQLEGLEEDVRVFTTRPDTLFGATYMVLAPEHPLVDRITTEERRQEVEAYRSRAARMTEVDRMAEGKQKTGVFTGGYATNPVSAERIPVWVADYVLMGYGTGAIMAVPAHDQRDFEFAKTFRLPIRVVVQPPLQWLSDHDIRAEEYIRDPSQLSVAFTGAGVGVNSRNKEVSLDGVPSAEAKERITDWLDSAGLGHFEIQYKLRDWLFSRQRYWGEPFPVLHGSDGVIRPVDEEELPVELPAMDDFTPTVSDDPNAPPQPPLSRAPEAWRQVVTEGAPLMRELNTMPQWAGSCWYYLRFIDPGNAEEIVEPEKESYWMGDHGVDLYVGGVEHAVLHLLYARFWHKVLYDLGHVSTPEPFGRLFNQGYILAYAYRDERGVIVPADEVVDQDGVPAVEVQDQADRKYFYNGAPVVQEYGKMGKSLKNAVSPDEISAAYGCDTLRLYEMYLGPLEASKPWSTRDIVGVHRFLNRYWRNIIDDDEGTLLVSEEAPSEELLRAAHRTIQRVTSDLDRMSFNTAIAALIELNSELVSMERIPRAVAEILTLLLAPFAPHIAEEIWSRMGHKESIGCAPWPQPDSDKLREDEITVAVQVNGKVRASIQVPADATESAVLEAASAHPNVERHIAGKSLRRQIYVPGKIVNLVVS
jgi:leucyl-tRNA synthetase